MHARWWPFVEQLSRDAGTVFELKLYDSMDSFESDVIAGKPDFVYLHSAQMVGAKIAQGYLPLIRNSRPVAGSFVVRKDSPVRSLRDLDGKTVAFVGRKNLCRTLLDHVLVDEEHISVDSIYTGTPGNMVKHVILSKADAGGALDVNLDKLPQSARDQIRIIYTTPKIAPHALAAHPRVAHQVRDRVTSAILRIASNTRISEILRPVQIESPVRADYQRDYQVLEKLDISRYFGQVD